MKTLTLPFTIAAAECSAGLTASLPALTDLLQEAAGRHADALGVGLQTLQAQGQTWMLGRLSVRLQRSPVWQEAVRVETWPNGVRGRLVAERQFRLLGADGACLLEASSEWLCVDMAAQRLARLPELVQTFGGPNVSNLGHCATRLPALPPDAPCVGEVSFPVRRAEIDANHHVSNGHYTRWIQESLPEGCFFGSPPQAFDIEYKLAARLGDSVCIRSYALGEAMLLHTVTRVADQQLLARACSTYATPCEKVLDSAPPKGVL